MGRTPTGEYPATDEGSRAPRDPKFQCAVCDFECPRSKLSLLLGFTCPECFKRTLRRSLPQMVPAEPESPSGRARAVKAKEASTDRHKRT